MKCIPRTVLSLASLGLVATACGSSGTAERPTITATPTTVFVPESAAPVTEPPVTTAAPAETETADTDEIDDSGVEPVGTELDGTELDGTEPPDTVTSPDDPLYELAKEQLVLAGLSEQDAACVTSYLDFTDPGVLAQDPAAIAPAFETCDVAAPPAP